RLGVIDELVHLARIGNDHVIGHARTALERLAKDDSKTVCQAASGALAQLQFRIASNQPTYQQGDKERIQGGVEKSAIPLAPRAMSAGVDGPAEVNEQRLVDFGSDSSSCTTSESVGKKRWLGLSRRIRWLIFLSCVAALTAALVAGIVVWR